MKVTAFLTASLIAFSCFAQESNTKPSLSFVQAAQIAQDTLTRSNLGAEFYLQSLQLTTRKERPTEAIYEARFEPPGKTSTRAQGEPQLVRYRVIAIDMQGRGTIEDREFKPIVIRRRIPLETHPPEEAKTD
jgi:hypothetical protein